MGLTVVNIGTNTSTSGATVAVTVGASGVPAGVTIFVCVTEKNTAGTAGTVADTATNTYSTITSGSLAATAADGFGMVFAVNQNKALVNTNTITYTKQLSGSVAAISAFYVSGVKAGSSFTEGLATATGTTGTITVTSGTINRGNLIIGALLDSGSSVTGGNATFTNSTNFVTPPVEANNGGSGNARVNGGVNTQATSGTATYNPSYSSTAQQWFLAAFGAISSMFPTWFPGEGFELPPRPAIVPALAIALMSSGYFGPPVEPAVNECAFQGDAFQFTPRAFQACFVTNLDEYYIPLSEPVRTPPRSADFPVSEAFVPIVQQDLVTSWYVPLSEPVRTKPIDVWFQDWTKGTQPVVSFSYYLPLSEPVRTPLRDAWYQPDILTRTASDVIGIKYLPLAEPPKPAPRAAWYQEETTSPFPLPPATVAIPTGSWSQPTQTITLQYQSRSALVRTASDVTGIQYPPLAEPPKPAQRTAWYQDETTAFVTTPTTPADSWLPVYPDTVPAAARTPWYQALFYLETAPFPEEVSEDRWHQPWSEPVRIPLRDAWFQDSARNINPVVSFSYYAPLVDPVRIPLRDAWFQPDTKSTQPVVSFSYYQPLVDPVRVPPRDAWFQPDTLTRTASDVTGIQYPPLSEPVRAPLRDTWFQPDALVQIVQQDTVTSWFVPLSDPVRIPLRDAWYQDYTANVFPLPNVTSTIGWFAALVDPVRVPLRDAWFQPDTLTRTASDVTGIQYPPLAEPVRTPLRDAWFQPDTLGRQASDVTGIQYPALSEPVRVAPRDAWFQPVVVEEIQPVVSFSYFNWLSEPVRTPPRAADFPATALGQPASDVTGIQYLALVDPVRTALRDAWYQDATSFNPFPLPPVTVFVSGWGAVFPDFARPAPRVAYNQELAFVVGAVVPPPAAATLMSWEPWVDPPPPLPIIALREGWPTYIDSVDNAQPDTGKVWRRYWIQDDPNHILNRDAPHDLVWADEDDVITVLLL